MKNSNKLIFESVDALILEADRVILKYKTKKNIKVAKDYFKYEFLADQTFSDIDKYGEETWND
jgi:hypothetical protein